MLRAVKVRLYPNDTQKSLLSQHFGACRFIYNYMLDKKIKAHEKGVQISAFDLKKMLPKLKLEPDYAWLKTIDSQALQESVLDLKSAYDNFFRDVKKGIKAGFPKFHSRHNSRQSFQYPQRVKISDDGKYLYLPKIGWVKAKIHRPITAIKTVTISMEANQYHASLLTDVKDSEPINNGLSISLDMGVANFATLSDGSSAIKPISFKKEYKRLEVLQKQLSRKTHSRYKGDTTPQSNNFKKQKTKVRKQWLKIANKRKDFLHKCSKQLSVYQTVVVEDLKIKNMSKSAKGTIEDHGKNVKQKSGLNRNILKQSWGMFFEMLEYKLKQNGNELIRVNPHNTSNECSKCGYTNKENRESQSIFICKSCGYAANADFNASLNILHRGITRNVPAIKPTIESVEQEALVL